MKKARYEWRKVGAGFELGFSESIVWIRTTSRVVDLKFSNDSKVNMNIREFWKNKQFDNLETYIKYLFMVNMYMGENEFVGDVMELISDHASKIKKDETI